MILKLSSKLKRLAIAALMTTAFFAQGAWSQTTKKPADVFVGYCARTKPIPADCDAQYGWINDALDAVGRNSIIEIIDDSTYAEHVIITDKHRGLTIRSSNPTSRDKPVIKFQDTRNVYPKSNDDDRNGGFQACYHTSPPLPPRPSGWTPPAWCSDSLFDQNGTVSIRRTKSITLDGLTIDGGGIYTFTKYTPSGNAHGNATVSIFSSGNVTIRNCDLRNAFIGINFKDRNEAGAFAIQNPDDPNEPIPLSGFGDMGGHLIEYNRIYDNASGTFSEQQWDLGSTIRYNLFYNNYYQDKDGAPVAAPTPMDQKNTGAIVFRDVLLAPWAIHNNTFFDNAGYIVERYRVTGVHLIFNNIFSRRKNGNQLERQMEPYFYTRLHNSVYSGSALTIGTPNVEGCRPNVNPQPPAPQIPGITDVKIYGGNGFDATLARAMGPVQCPSEAPYDGRIVDFNGFVPHGSYVANSVPNAQNVRWVQTEGYRSGTTTFIDTLFQSINRNDANFLHPKWEHPDVIEYIKGQGWAAVGMLNSNGQPADLGAIPSTGTRAPIVARAVPTNVIQVSGTSATAKFHFEAYDANTSLPVTLTEPKIKFLRWIAPVPYPPSTGGWDVRTLVPTTSINDIPAAIGTSVYMGGNTIPITIGTFNVDAVANKYGFFEMVIEGIDPTGQKVISDVAFFPYTLVKYVFDVEVFDRLPNGSCATSGGTPLTSTYVGDSVCLRLTAYSVSSTGAKTPYTGPITRVGFSLFTDNQSSTLWNLDSTALIEDRSPSFSNGVGTWPVFFQTAGNEQIRATGVVNVSGTLDGILGVGDIKVSAGKPEKVVFITPPPLSTLWDETTNTYATAQTIPVGGPYNVTVGVTDKYGNLVDVAVPLEMKYLRQDPNAACASVGKVLTPTATTDTATGTAIFQVEVDCGLQGEWFDMRAEIMPNTIGGAGGSGVGAADTARLRVGRATTMLRIMYGDSGDPTYAPIRTKSRADSAAGNWWKQDFDVDDAPITIEKNTGEYARVWIKVINADTVMTSKNFIWVCVSSNNDNLRMAADVGNTRPDTAAFVTGSISVPVVNGVAALWLTSDQPIDNATLTASPRLGNGCGENRDVTINETSRWDIMFNALNVRYQATVYSNDPHGRPEYADIFLNRDHPGFGPSYPLPASVTLSWPSALGCAAALGTGTAKSITLLHPDSTHVVRVTFDTADFPKNYTVFTSGNTSTSAMTITAGDGIVYSANQISVEEKIGPQITGSMQDDQCDRPISSIPVLTDNKTKTLPDELLIQTSEAIGSGGGAMKGQRLDVKRGDEEFTVIIEDVIPNDGNSYTLYLAQNSEKLEDGDSVRFAFSASGGITDAAGNAVVEGNPYVVIMLKEDPPEVIDAWYTANDSTGLVDYAYYVFDKQIDTLSKWFGNGKLRFTWDGRIDSLVIQGNGGTALAVKKADNGKNDTLVVDLREAFKLSQDPARWPTIAYQALRGVAPDQMRSTSAAISSDITYNPGKGWSPLTGVSVLDRANPVLVYAKLQVGKPDAPDTLTLTFSEPVANANETNSPVMLAAQNLAGGFREVNVVFDRHFDEYKTFQYLVYGNVTPPPVNVPDANNPEGRYPQTGDRAKINNTLSAPLADDLGNKQTAANNRNVPLVVDYGDPDWDITIRNNPFKGGTDKPFTLVIGSVTKAEIDFIRSEIKIYDNMGKLVMDDVVEYYPQSADDRLEWKWDGRNKNGRYVGTGSYILVTSSIAVVRSAEAGSRPIRRRQMIGFVRGK